MPRCYSDKCRRENLPIAAGYPPVAKIAPAHVRPDGEPCGEVPGTYAEDMHELIMNEDGMWDLDAAAPAVEREAPPAPREFEPAPERPLPDYSKAEAPADTTPAKPAKPARKKAAKKAPRVQAEEVDVDEWNP